MEVVRGKQIHVLFSEEKIQEQIEKMAKEIAKNPKNDLLVVAVLKGSFIFAADLVRALYRAGLAPEVEFITLSSYGTGTEGKAVKIIKDIDSNVEGRDVLLIDDILESGNTLRFARDLMYERGAKDVGLAVLLDKESKRKGELVADHVGFICPDYFVVGYGMDVAYAFRELPYVGIVQGDAE
jgi:hypoxanthine phosphoribosyltransferase